MIDEYEFLVQAVRRGMGVDLAQYKRPQMERRLRAFADRHGVPGLAVLARRLREDPDLQRAFEGYFTINVSEFYRDPLRWEELRGAVLPELLRHRRALRAWSAGCSIGAEAYTLAMLLAERAPLARHFLLGTDIDARALVWAASGRGYRDPDVRALPADLRDRYLRHEADGWAVTAEVRRSVTFVRHDLLRDPCEQDFDLVVCRNVVIYFTESAKNALYRRLVASLRPGGILFVGGTEVVSRPHELGLEPVRVSFYRRRAVARAA